MVMPTTTATAITFDNLRTTFNGATPVSLNDYHASGMYMAAGATGTYGAVPSTGAISMNNLYGTTVDLIPAANSFTNVGGASLSTYYYSNIITVTGLQPNYPIPVSIYTSGSSTYFAAGSTVPGSFISSGTMNVTSTSSGTIVIQCLVYSAATLGGANYILLNVGGTSNYANFTVTNRLADLIASNYGQFSSNTSVVVGYSSTSQVIVAGLEPSYSIPISWSGTGLGGFDAASEASGLTGLYNQNSRNVTTTASGTLVLVSRAIDPGLYTTPGGTVTSMNTITVGQTPSIFTHYINVITPLDYTMAQDQATLGTTTGTALNQNIVSAIYNISGVTASTQFGICAFSATGALTTSCGIDAATTSAALTGVYSYGSTAALQQKFVTSSSAGSFYIRVNGYTNNVSGSSNYIKVFINGVPGSNTMNPTQFAKLYLKF
jgi:hypothetical protein